MLKMIFRNSNGNSKDACTYTSAFWIPLSFVEYNDVYGEVKDNELKSKVKDYWYNNNII